MFTKLTVLLLVWMTAFPDVLHGITTIHHDKPEESSISKMVTKMTEPVPSTTVMTERHKRLLPYINYYLSRNQQKPTRENFTPFLESNAVPGPFIPIINTTPKNILQYESEPPTSDKNPNYVDIYETLARLKQAQQGMRHNHIFRKPIIRLVPIRVYQDDLPEEKTNVHTYTPTNIDIEVGERKNAAAPPVGYKLYPYKQPTYAIEKPVENYRPQFVERIIAPVPTNYVHNEKSSAYPTSKPHTNAIVNEEYVAQKYTTQEAVYLEQAPPVEYVSERPLPHVPQYYSSPQPNVAPENTNILAKLLKQLQNSNMLPRTLTADNIDNSIKTLVKILNDLKKKQQDLKQNPIVVVPEDSRENEETGEEAEKPLQEKHNYSPATFTQVFPANTIDGGTPGRPGIDYPALATIPQTDFNCKTQRYKGFFGDPHTNCQVWHYCDLNGGQASFLCPNGTIFSQVALTCDWWYNVKCSSTAQLYVLNERLYKYILPLAPKFPEDYSGPLVDKYLALKFQEMEEKMKKEKKEEGSGEEEKDDSDQLQDIQNEKAKLLEEN